ncbi:MAG: uroporphyrinogen decarboxylase [Verrucomicrobia bacterium]|nr:uroporphyrinogen decarboxylase [Verrucomicrobiota bacterium]
MPNATPFNDAFLRACRGERADHIPAWYMRQAGRFQPEYRAIKAHHTLSEIVAQPDLCAQVTRLPVDQLGVDAAIMFADIMTPIEAMGIAVEIRDGIGPCLDDPLRTADDIALVDVPDYDQDIPFVAETIKQLRATLTVPLIGFCGAPFTLACYLVEGGPTKHYAHVKALMYGDSPLWHQLMERLTRGMVAYLAFQARAGAQALQVFDSWVGSLGVDDYQTFVLPHMQNLFAETQRLTDVPLIHFGTNTGHLLESLSTLGADVIGIDWRVRLADAWSRLGDSQTIQGNLDPGLLLGPIGGETAAAQRILDQVDRPGFIFNLGHGVLPQTPVEHLKRLTDFVHAHRSVA